MLFKKASEINANKIRLKEEALTAQLNPFGSIASSFQTNSNN
jgi:hypothetical protein